MRKYRTICKGGRRGGGRRKICFPADRFRPLCVAFRAVYSSVSAQFSELQTLSPESAEPASTAWLGSETTPMDFSLLAASICSGCSMTVWAQGVQYVFFMSDDILQ